MQKDSRKNEERLLPFETIKAATEGDVDAMDKILKHYKPYIVKLSIRTDGDKSYIDEGFGVNDFMSCHQTAHTNCHQIA